MHCKSRKSEIRNAILSVGLILLIAAPAAADGGGFARTEYEVLGGGASTLWQGRTTFHQIGGQGTNRPDEFGSSAPEEEKKVAGPSQTGARLKSGLMSAVLPGAGQWNNGDKQKAYIMGGIEVAIWTAWFVFDKQGDNKRTDSEEWAALYAGTGGSHPDRYWQNVGRYTNSDAYIESLLRESRALGESTAGIGDDVSPWQWVNEDRRLGYSQLRADGNSAYDRRDFMILFAVVNRAVSVVDAVLGAGNAPGSVGGEVLGMDVEMRMVPSWNDPGARWTISRSF